MTYLSYYKYYPNRTDLEDINSNTNENISTEGLSFKKIIELLKNLFDRVSNFLRKVFNYIKEKMISFFSNKKTKKRIAKLNSFIKLMDVARIHADKEVTDIIHSWAESTKHNVDGMAKIYQSLCFDKNGNAFTMSNIINSFDDILKRTDEYFGKENFDKIDNIHYIGLTIATKIHGEELMDISKMKFSVKGVFNNVNKIDEYLTLSNNFIKKRENDEKKKLDTIRKEMDELNKSGLADQDKYKKLNAELNSRLLFLRATTIPYNVVLQYIQICETIAAAIGVSDVMVTDDIPSVIYHLSDNSNLGDELLPRNSGFNSG